MSGLYGWHTISSVPVYDAHALIQVTAYEPEYFGGDKSVPSEALSAISTIKGDHLMAAVVGDLGLDRNADFLGFAPRTGLSAADSSSLIHYASTRLREGLHVELVTDTNLARVDFFDRDPELATRIVNRLVDDYIVETAFRGAPAAQRAAKFLAPNLSALRRQSADLQSKLLDMQRTLGVPDFDPRKNQIALSLQALLHKSLEARTEHARAQTEATLLAPTTIRAETTDALADDDSSQRLRAELDAALLNAAGLATQLGPANPALLAANARVRAAAEALAAQRHELLAVADSSLEIAQAYDSQLSAKFMRERDGADVLAPKIAAYIEGQREFFEIRALYFQLRSRVVAAEIDPVSDGIEITVAARATVPTAPVDTGMGAVVLRYTALGGLLAFVLLGTAKLAAREQEITVAAIEQISGLPALTVVPAALDAGPGNVMEAFNAELFGVRSVGGARSAGVQQASGFLFAEAMLTLRGALHLTPLARPLQYILFTSATPSEGKTTVSAAIATAMALRGDRILLIDADMRRPKVHQLFGLSSTPGLSGVLNGSATLRQCLQHVEAVPGLDVLASGAIPPLPGELLGSRAMAALLHEVRHSYTHVLIDSPPVLAVSDALEVARQVDGVVWVVRDRSAGRAALRRALALLRSVGAPMAGIVLNAAQGAARDEKPRGVDAWWRELFKSSARASSSDKR